MNTRRDREAPNTNSPELHIRVQGQLFSQEVLEAVIRDLLVPALVKQLLSDSPVQQALFTIRGPQAPPVDRKQRPNPHLLNINEAAERLGIRPATVRAWIASRKIPMVKLGRCVRIPVEAINRFIESNTVPAVR